MKKSHWLKLGFVIATAVTVVGCDTLGRTQTHRANNLFNYLYAEETTHMDVPTIPVLSLPLRVGMAFVPPDQTKGNYNYSYSDDAVFSENQKSEMLREVSEQFKNYPFVKSIELIPTTYLTPKGGFSNLDQIRTMYGVDVIILLSYDQVQFTDQGILSLSYWTIVGAYVVRGEKNDTRTMLDAAVYDIASRKLLFRAPGIGEVKGTATPVNLNEQLRKDSEQGFKQASTNLISNLKVELEKFQERVKKAPDDYKVVHKPGYTGAASFTGIEIALFAAIGTTFLWMRRRNHA